MLNDFTARTAEYKRSEEIGRDRKRSEEIGRDRIVCTSTPTDLLISYVSQLSVDISSQTINPVVLLVKKGKFIACGKGKYNESHIGTVEDTEHNVCKELLA